MNSKHDVDYTWPGVLAVFIAIDLLVTAGGLMSALLSGHGWPIHHADKAIAVIWHPGNPSLVWEVPVGPAWFFWTCVAVVLAVVIGVPLYVANRIKARVRRRADDPTKLPGLADRREVIKVAGAKQLLARGSILRPSVPSPAASDLGLLLGSSRRVGVYFSVEDSMIIVGPPRSGKGYYLAIRMILDAPGPVVTTSTRPDNLAVTMHARRTRGPIAVFDPQNLARGVSRGRRWSPIRGCRDAQTAINRAAALCAGADSDVEDGAFWLQQATTVVRCLLHAAALDGLTVSDLYRWSLSPAAAMQAVAILAQSPEAIPLWSEELDAVISLEPKQRGSVWSFVKNVFAPLANPEVMAELTPAPGEEFDPVRFLLGDGTLYLLGTAAGALATANIASALIEDVVETARYIAAASTGQRLDRPLSLVLDEAANFPLPSLGALMSEGGGTGITTVAIVQAHALLRHRWGYEMAQAIWDSATFKIILGGGSSAGDLRDLSELIGDRDVTETSVSHHDGGGRSISESTRQRATLEVSTIRTLKTGHALLLLRTAKPIVLTLEPWTTRADARELRASKAAVEEMLRLGALSNRSNRA